MQPAWVTHAAIGIMPQFLSGCWQEASHSRGQDEKNHCHQWPSFRRHTPSFTQHPSSCIGQLYLMWQGIHKRIKAKRVGSLRATLTPDQYSLPAAPKDDLWSSLPAKLMCPLSQATEVLSRYRIRAKSRFPSGSGADVDSQVLFLRSAHKYISFNLETYDH